MSDDETPTDFKMTLYALFDTEDNESVEYGFIFQKAHRGLDTDGFRLCSKTQISKSLSVTQTTAPIPPDLASFPPTTETPTVRK